MSRRAQLKNHAYAVCPTYAFCRFHAQHPDLDERDLCHLASCQRRGVSEIMIFDRDLKAALGSPSIP